MGFYDQLEKALKYGHVSQEEIWPFLSAHLDGVNEWFDGPNWHKSSPPNSVPLSVLADRLGDVQDPREPIVRRSFEVSGKVPAEHLAEMLDYTPEYRKVLWGQEGVIPKHIKIGNRKEHSTVDGQILYHTKVTNPGNGKSAYVVQWHPHGREGRLMSEMWLQGALTPEEMVRLVGHEPKE